MIQKDAIPDIMKYADFISSKGYKVIRSIGKGGFSTCLLAFSDFYKDYFVIKCSICKDNICDLAELDALKNLNHPGVIHLYDYFFYENNEAMFLVLEYCEAGSLANFMTENKQYSVNMMISMYRSLLTSLAYIHSKGIAHLDIKPGNILIDKYQRPKFADFGTAVKFSSQNSANEIGRGKEKVKEKKDEKCFYNKRAGTLHFMPPEMINMKSPIDPFKSDIWSLGVTFYYMATESSFPFDGCNVQEIEAEIIFGEPRKHPNITPEIHSLLKMMLNLNSDRRPIPRLLLTADIFTMTEIDTIGSLGTISKIRPERSSGYLNRGFVWHSLEGQTGIGASVGAAAQLARAVCTPITQNPPTSTSWGTANSNNANIHSLVMSRRRVRYQTKVSTFSEAC